MAAEPLKEECVETTSTSTRAISGYGQALNLSNTEGIIYVNVSVTSGSGYGLTLKTSGTGTATISVEKPDGTMLYLDSNWGKLVNMSNTSERAWNFSNVQAGTYKVHYLVSSGPLDIVCHIYG